MALLGSNMNVYLHHQFAADNRSLEGTIRSGSEHLSVFMGFDSQGNRIGRLDTTAK